MNKADWYAGGWIQTFTGRKFFPLSPQIEDICIEDIAHALSNICRYGGHCREFYSVAQHCCMVSDWIPSYKLEGLLHDSTEAYLGDLVRPVKHSESMKGYRDAEHLLEGMINVVFGLDLSPEVKTFVKGYDNRALYTERKFILTNHDCEWSDPFPMDLLIPWTPAEAKDQFLERYFKLQRERISL